jgi:hypothetical protein
VSKIRVGAVSLDCADPGPLSAFWADLLGGELIVTTDAIGVVKLELPR